METQNKESTMKKNNMKWLVFIVLCLAYMPGSYGQYQLSVFAPEIMSAYGLNTSQFSSIFTSPMIIAIFLSFVGGMISDKVGSKKVINLSFIIALTGLIGRIFANSYWPFFFCMALTGFSQMFVNINASKITGNWFKPAQMGMLMGIFALCGQLPSAFATATTAFLFDNMTTAYIASAIFAAAVFVLWIVFAKDKPNESTDGTKTGIKDIENTSIGESLKVVLSNRGVWCISVCVMMILGVNVTLSTFLPTALNNMYGIDMAVCGGIASMVTLGNCIGSLVGPIMFAKIRKVNIFVPVSSVLSFTGVLVCWRFDSIPVLYVLTLFAGTALGIAIPIFLSAPILLEGIGTKYAGSAAGVIATLQLLGAVLIPTYILTPIAGDNLGLLFTLSSVCMAIMFAVGLMIPEFGNNAD